MRLGTSHHTSYTVECPYCGAKMDGQAQVDGDGVPSEGAIAVCMYCTMVSIFEGDPPALRMPTKQEQLELVLDERLYAVRRAAAQMWAERKGADDDQPT